MPIPQQVLQRRSEQGLYRRRLVLEGAQGPRIRLEGREYLNFCSNDYLGLAAHPAVAEAFARGLSRYGAGSGASHLVCGHTEAHESLEQSLAQWLGRERALLFSSGYLANIGVIDACCGRGDHIYLDRLNHASMVDGALLSRARWHRFAHRDISALEQLLAQQRDGGKWILSDGVFSMDGDLAPLPELAAIAHQHEALLYVDDAHGFGVLGPNGRGSCEHFALSAEQVPLLMCTLGKAAGVGGAVVAGDESWIEMLIQLARSSIYTTAMPPAQAVAIEAALAIIRSQPERREHLNALIERFRNGARQLGLPLGESVTPIQPLLTADPQRTVELSLKLRARGLLLVAIRPPTVPAGTSRLRVSLTAAHSEADVDQLLQTLGDCLS